MRTSDVKVVDDVVIVVALVKTVALALGAELLLGDWSLAATAVGLLFFSR